jgi:hypothetical protein
MGGQVNNQDRIIGYQDAECCANCNSIEMDFVKDENGDIVGLAESRCRAWNRQIVLGSKWCPLFRGCHEWEDK